MQLKKALNFLLYGNIYISICAVGLTAETYLISGHEIELDALMVLVFCSTFFIYTFHRLIIIGSLNQETFTPRLQWIYDHSPLLKLLSISALIVAIIAFLFLNFSIMLALVLSAIIAVMYAMPFIPKNKIKVALRDFGVVKVVIVALVWTVITSLLPILNMKGYIHDPHVPLLLIERFLFIFVLTLLFEIRDQKIDQEAGIRTIPKLLGEGLSKVSAYVLICIFALMYGFHDSSMERFFIPLFMSALITIIIIRFTTKEADDYYYMAYVDGMMILQFLFVLIFS